MQCDTFLYGYTKFPGSLSVLRHLADTEATVWLGMQGKYQDVAAFHFSF